MTLTIPGYGIPACCWFLLSHLPCRYYHSRTDAADGSQVPGATRRGPGRVWVWPPGGHAHRGRSKAEHAGAAWQPGQLATRDSKSYHCVSASAAGLGPAARRGPDGWMDRGLQSRAAPLAVLYAPVVSCSARLPLPSLPLWTGDLLVVVVPGQCRSCVAATARGGPAATVGAPFLSSRCHDKRASMQWETSGNAVVGALLDFVAREQRDKALGAAWLFGQRVKRAERFPSKGRIDSGLPWRGMQQKLPKIARLDGPFWLLCGCFPFLFSLCCDDRITSHSVLSHCIRQG